MLLQFICDKTILKNPCGSHKNGLQSGKYDLPVLGSNYKDECFIIVKREALQVDHILQLQSSSYANNSRDHKPVQKLGGKLFVCRNVELFGERTQELGFKHHFQQAVVVILQLNEYKIILNIQVTHKYDVWSIFHANFSVIVHAMY